MPDSPRSKRPAPLARGRAKRVLKVGELATSVGSSYVWEALKSPFRSAGKRQQSLLDTHVRNAMRIDILPSEALKVLSVVQSQVPPMDIGEIRAQVKRELGKYPEQLFREFDEEAFAAASLGQVHRA